MERQKKYYSKQYHPFYKIDNVNNRIYLVGCYSLDKFEPNITTYENCITVLDYNTLNIVHNFKVETDSEEIVSINKLFFEPKLNLLLVTGECTLKNNTKKIPNAYDVVYLCDLNSQKLGRIDLYTESSDDKEGGITDVISNSINEKIYVSLAYAEGGDKNLHVINMNEQGNDTKIRIGDEGALELFLYNNSIIAFGKENNCSHLYRVNLNNIVDKIPLPENDGHFSTNISNIIASGQDNSVYVIVNNNLYLVNLDLKCPVTSIKKNNIVEVASNTRTNKTYVIHYTKDKKDTYYISLIDKNFELEKIFNSNHKLNSIYINDENGTLYFFETKKDNIYEHTLHEIKV